MNFTELRESVEPGYLIHDPMSRHGIYLNRATYGEDRSVLADWNLLWAGIGDFDTAIRSLNLSKDDEQGLIALGKWREQIFGGYSARRSGAFRPGNVIRNFCESASVYQSRGSRLPNPG